MALIHQNTQIHEELWAYNSSTEIHQAVDVLKCSAGSVPAAVGTELCSFHFMLNIVYFSLNMVSAWTVPEA